MVRPSIVFAAGLGLLGCFEDPGAGAPSSGSTASSTDGSTGVGVSADGSTGAGSTADGSTGAGPSGNLLANPSFEEWAGGLANAWTATENLTLVRNDMGALDGTTLLEASAATPAVLSQAIELVATIPAGTSVSVALAYRHLEGDLTAPGIELDGVQGGGGAVVIVPATSTPPFAMNEWAVGGGSVETAEAFIGLEMRINISGVGMQLIQLDDARVSIEP